MLLSRAITLAESTRLDHRMQAQAILEGCLPHTGRAVRLGITGVPGVGKSTFIEAFGTMLTEKGKSVAVLAIDPRSEKTKGSILGDKTRMEQLSLNPQAYIRPSSSGGALGGVAPRTREAMLLCEAAGFDVVLIETVGVGQSEVEVASLVDFFLLLMLAGAGDELQGIKRGIMEMADGVAITKADGDNRAKALAARGEFRRALHLLWGHSREAWQPQVQLCSAMTGEGVENVWDMILSHRDCLMQNGQLQAKRQEQARFWMYQVVESELKRLFFTHSDVQACLPELEQNVKANRISPTAAATTLLRAFDQGELKLKL